MENDITKMATQVFEYGFSKVLLKQNKDVI